MTRDTQNHQKSTQKSTQNREITKNSRDFGSPSGLSQTSGRNGRFFERLCRKSHKVSETSQNPSSASTLVFTFFRPYTFNLASFCVPMGTYPYLTLFDPLFYDNIEKNTYIAKIRVPKSLKTAKIYQNGFLRNI